MLVHLGEGDGDGVGTLFETVGHVLEHVLHGEVHAMALCVVELGLQEVVAARGVSTREPDHQVDDPDAGGHHPPRLLVSMVAENLF